MSRSGLPIIILVLLPTVSFSQQSKEQIQISGYTFESDSLKVLPFIHISNHPNSFIRSDQKGHFIIKAGRTDTLTFSGVGYETVKLNLNEASFDVDTLYLDILMKQKVYDMNEAIIVPFHTYSELKTALINMEPDPGNLNAMAKRDADLIMQQNKVIEGPGLDAYSNYRLVMNRMVLKTDPVTILSTDPTKGLFSLLHELGVTMPWMKKK